MATTLFLRDYAQKLSIASIIGSSLLLGCNHQPSIGPDTTISPQSAVTQDATPQILAPAFKVFHQQATIVTLIVSQQTSALQVENLIWLLRDFAHSRSLNSLGINETLIDNRNPIVWFQIYRGTRCADEHYGKGKLPCGSAEHEAGWYMYGTYADHDGHTGDAGVVYYGSNETKGEALWQVNAPYLPKPFIKPS